MARGTFTFRITSEGVDELKRQLEAIGPAGQKAFDQLRQMSPQLQNSFEQAGKAADQARAKIEQMPRGIAAVSAGFERAESSVKAAGRTFNDAVGAFQLIAPNAGAAGQALGTLSSTIGNVSDVFGILAAGLSKNPFGAIVAAIGVAGTAFVALKTNILGIGDAVSTIKPQLEGLDGLIKGLDTKIADARGGVMGDVERKASELLRMRRAAEIDLQRLQANGGIIDMSGAGSSFGVMPDTEGEARKRVDRLSKEIADLDKKLNELEQRRQTLRQLEAEGADFTNDPTNARGRARADRERAEIREREQAAEQARRAAEADAQRIERENAQTRADEERMLANYLKREQTVEKLIGKMEEEARLTGQTNEQREVGLRLFDAQSKLIDELGNKTRDLTDLEKQRISNAVRTKNAMEEQQKAAERLQQEIDRAAKRSTDRLVDFAGDAIFDRLTGKVTNFWETFRTFGLRAISQVAAEAVIRPIVAPIVGGVVGAAPALFGAGSASAATSGGSSGGGIGSIFSSPISSIFSAGSQLFGGGGIGGAVSSLASPLTAIGSGIAGLAGYSVGTAGAMVGASAVGGPAFLGGATSLASGAGAVGAGLISPLAATGIGALIAIPALLALSGVFGKKKSVGPFASYAAGLMPDGSLAFRGAGEKNGGSLAAMQDATQSFADSIKQVSRALSIYKLPALNIGVGSNQARGTFFGTAGDESGAVYFGQDPGVAAAAYIRAALQGRLKDSNLVSGRLEASSAAAQLFARTTGNPQTDLEFVAVYQGFDKVGAAAAKVAGTLDELNAKFDDYARLAREYGLEVDRVEKARQEAIETAVTQLVQPVVDRFASVRSLVASLQVGPASPLSADRQLSMARDQFDTLASSALGGDEAAQRALGDSGRAYLDLARGFFGTSEQYGEVYSSVLGRLGSLITDVKNNDPIVRAVVETGQQGAAAIVKTLQDLQEELKRLRDEVRRGNDLPLRISG